MAAGRTGRRYTKFQAPGDQVEGVVLAAETRPSKFEGKIERVLTIEKIDGSVTLVSCPTDLARKAEVLIGDVVRITFVNFKPVDAGLMKVFSVGVAVQDMQPDDRGGDDRARRWRGALAVLQARLQTPGPSVLPPAAPRTAIPSREPRSCPVPSQYSDQTDETPRVSDLLKVHCDLEAVAKALPTDLKAQARFTAWRGEEGWPPMAPQSSTRFRFR